MLTFNVFGLILAATGVWSYPRDYTGAFILGNLYIAILVRNELFGRFLYLFVNKLFAKVSLVGVSLSLALHPLTFSGPRLDSVWHAHLPFNTSAVSTLDAPFQDSFGLYFGLLYCSLTTRTSTMPSLPWAW